MLSDLLSVLSVCLSVCPVCDDRALWPTGWTDQDETRLAGSPRPWPHCVTWGPTSPSPKGAQSPQMFGPYLLRLGEPARIQARVGKDFQRKFGAKHGKKF